MSDFVVAVGMLVFMAAVAAAYLAQMLMRGRARHERADIDGGSLFVGKPIMEMGYWLIGPSLRFCRALRITPNMVTAFSLVPGLFAAVALAEGRFGLGCVLATVSAICDMLDGVLARALRTESAAGEVFDAAADRYSEFFLLGGITFHFRNDGMLLVVALAATFGSFMISYGTAKAEAVAVPPPRGSMRRAERALYIITAAGLTPFYQALLPGLSRSFREAPIIIALALVALVSNISVVRRFSSVYRTLRLRDQMRAHGAPSLAAVHSDPGAVGDLAQGSVSAAPVDRPLLDLGSR